MRLEITRSDGVKLFCGAKEDLYEILEKEGTSNVESEVFYDEKGSGYGDIKTGQRIRSRKFSYTIRAKGDPLIARRNLNTFFNPLYKFRVRSTIKRDLWLDADLIGIKDSEKEVYSQEIIELSFTATDPYWNDSQDTIRRLYTQNGLWHYPYALVPLNKGLQPSAYTVYGQLSITDTVYIYNDGDASTEFKIVIQSPVVNPKISVNNATVEFRGEVKSGEKLVLDFIKKEYKLNNINVFPKVKILGEISLQIGDNTIKTNTPLVGDIFFNKKYNGDI